MIRTQLTVDQSGGDPAQITAGYAFSQIQSHTRAGSPNMYVRNGVTDDEIAHELGHVFGFVDEDTKVSFGQLNLRLWSWSVYGDSRMANAHNQSLMGFELVAVAQKYCAAAKCE